MKCQCPEPGKCPAHGGRVMSERQWGQCRSSDEFYDAFHALGAKPLGLGDRIAKVTHATGVARVVKAASKAVGKPCGCAKRQDKLNDLFPGREPSPAIDGGDAARFGDHGPAGAGEPEPPVR